MLSIGLELVGIDDMIMRTSSVGRSSPSHWTKRSGEHVNSSTETLIRYSAISDGEGGVFGAGDESLESVDESVDCRVDRSGGDVEYIGSLVGSS
jgi:hypothetical protein